MPSSVWPPTHPERSQLTNQQDHQGGQQLSEIISTINNRLDDDNDISSRSEKTFRGRKETLPPATTTPIMTMAIQRERKRRRCRSEMEHFGWLCSVVFGHNEDSFGDLTEQSDLQSHLQPPYPLHSTRRGNFTTLLRSRRRLLLLFPSAAAIYQRSISHQKYFPFRTRTFPFPRQRVSGLCCLLFWTELGPLDNKRLWRRRRRRWTKTKDVIM